LEESEMDSFWDWFWLMMWWFFFIAYLVIFFQIIADLFRDKDLSGWWKAVWVLVLIVAPFISALIYLIARGRGMAERQMAAAMESKRATDDYIRATAGTGSSSSPASEIAAAKNLLDSGAIDATEYQNLKARALA